MAERRWHWRVRRTIGAPPSAAWRALTGTAAWPKWGPSVFAASGPAFITRESRGTVRPTRFGPKLPWRIDAFVPERFWSWRVAGVPATGHAIAPGPDGTSTLVEFDAPWWAPFYVPVLWWGLRRLARLLEADQAPRPAAASEGTLRTGRGR